MHAILQVRVDGLGLEEASGDVGIDRAIRAVLASISFPPPPGGSFAGNVSIRIR